MRFLHIYAAILSAYLGIFVTFLLFSQYRGIDLLGISASLDGVFCLSAIFYRKTLEFPELCGMKQEHNWEI